MNLMRIKALSLVLLSVFALMFQGCSTEFEVYAPEKEIRVVYGVLNPEDSVQYIRISKAFQFEGDAIAYAAENDLSMKGLNVTLSGSNGTFYEATEVPNFPKEEGGIFIPSQTVYQFVTDGSGTGKEELVGGVTYQIQVGTPDANDYLTAETKVPGTPEFRGDIRPVSGAGTQTCLPTLALERKYFVEWFVGNRNDINDPLRIGRAFELRITLNYEENGESKSAMWGPTKLLEDNSACQTGTNKMCYGWAEKDLVGFFGKFFETPGITYTYETGDSCVPRGQEDRFPQSVVFEVTGVDQFLYNYMIVNDPKFTDLSGTKPEYTNLSGNIDAYGVFGSINFSRALAIFNPCTEALMGLNDRSVPPGCE